MKPKTHSRMKDKEKMLYVLGPEHLNKGSYISLINGYCSIYDIKLKDFHAAYRQWAYTLAMDNYSIVFKYGEKSKLLIYNPKKQYN